MEKKKREAVLGKETVPPFRDASISNLVPPSPSLNSDSSFKSRLEGERKKKGRGIKRRGEKGRKGTIKS